jgi:hypothetical protein
VFSRALSSHGLIRQSSSTVIFATHSIEYASAADQVVVLESEGNVTTQRDFDRTKLGQQFLAELSLRDSSLEQKSAQKDINGPSGLMPDTVPAPLQSQGSDFSLYKYYFASVPKSLLFAWLFALILTELGELSPGTSILESLLTFSVMSLTMWCRNISACLARSSPQ